MILSRQYLSPYSRVTILTTAARLDATQAVTAVRISGEAVYGARRAGHIESMAILKIARMGHPVLGRPALPVDDPAAPAIARLIEDMVDTLVDAKGAGLAAPQVHVPLRLVLFRVPPGREMAREESDGGESDGGESDGGESDGGESDGGESDGGESDGGESDGGESDGGESDSAPASALESPTVLINPEIEPIGESMVEDMEACLSLPGLAGMVPRHDRIRYRWTDTEGRTHECEAWGFHARVVQHECDHLDGILYPMRMTDLSTLAFTSELGRSQAAED